MYTLTIKCSDYVTLQRVMGKIGAKNVSFASMEIMASEIELTKGVGDKVKTVLKPILSSQTCTEEEKDELRALVFKSWGPEVFPEYAPEALAMRREDRTEEILKAAKEPPIKGKSYPLAQGIVDGEVTFVNVKNTVLDLAKAKGRNASLELLKKFGVEKITALKVEQYVAVVAEAQKVMNV